MLDPHALAPAKPPWRGRPAEWVRQHQALAGGVAGLLLGTFLWVSLGLVLLEREKHRRSLERDRREQAFASALEHSKATLMAMTGGMVEQMLSRRGPLPEVDRAFLSKVLPDYEAVATVEGIDAHDRTTRAAAYRQVGRIRHRLGDLALAERALREALQLYRGLAAESPGELDFRRDAARSHHDLGRLLRDAGRLLEAETELRNAITRQQGLRDDFPTRPDYRLDMARSHYDLGRLLQNMSRLKLAEETLREVLALLWPLAADYPGRAVYRYELAECHLHLGDLLRATDRKAEAERAYRDALSLYERLVVEHPSVTEYNTGLARALDRLALFAADRRDFAASLQFLERAGYHHQAALRPNPAEYTYRQSYRHHLAALVQTFAGLGNQASAARTAERMRDLDWDPGGDGYAAATALAACVPLVEKDTHFSPEQRRQQSQFYADQALTILRHAVAVGYADLARLKADPDLAAVRPRHDFSKLVAEIEAGQKSPGR